MYQEYPAEYIFYHDDPGGKYKTIYGNSVTQYRTRSLKEFQREIKLYSSKRIWESDINPVFRCLGDNYLGQRAPKLHSAIFDIEVAFHPERGYAPPEDPFNRITSITVYLSWLEKCVTLVMPPPTLTLEEATKIADTFDDTLVFEREGDMLSTFLDLIDDADVLTGWNSEGFDIPYTINRITKVLSKDDTRRMCLWGQFPKRRTFERFGAEQETYDLLGRVHMDYMQLYRKYNYEERHSYSLDSIGEYEGLGSKVSYDGTLEQLYNNDWRKFIDYNRQDVMLVVRIDQKLKFLDLANTIAHENTVLLPTVMGAVAVTEQAIINECHSQGLIVPNRKKRAAPKFNEDGEEEDSGAAGAYVAYPKKGLHEWIGGLDINSLYPSVIRALNMAPETIVAQLRPTYTDDYIAGKMAKGSTFADAWENMFGSLEYQSVMARDPAVVIMVDWEQDGRTTQHTAAELYSILFESDRPWALSGNGTVFTTERAGIVPGLLARWYAERKTLQAQAKKYNGVDQEQYEYYDKLQLVKKINLNSLYGALLNKGCRFEDHRIGQSTTLTGRVIVQHMASEVNRYITTDYNHVGEAVIYGDTDSVYFSAWPAVKTAVEAKEIEWTKERVVELYDQIGAAVNDSFPEFMSQAFHCPLDNGKIIRCGRELVGIKGLFITKKRYAILIYDKEGKRLDVNGQPGKVKAMGLDLKRSDTPKIVQEFLSSILLDILSGSGRDHAVERIIEFKRKFEALPPWHKGTPKRVNNLTSYREKEARQGRANMPGHVRAALNWNNLRDLNKDNYAMRIVDGQKVIVCKLRNNPIGYTSVAYPIDEQRLPAWFLELPFDDSEMEAAIVDKKVSNLLGVLKWDLGHDTNIKNSFNLFFS